VAGLLATHLRATGAFLAPAALILLLLLPLLRPLTNPYLPATHDGYHHIFRLYTLDRALRAGALYPRWLPEMGFGYGFPVLNFYAPLIYYAGELLHILGLGFLDSFRALIALGFVLPAWAFYAFARHSLDRAGALLGALFYSYAAYRVGDGYIRGALPEHWAFLFPPLLLLAIWHIGRSRSLRWALLGGVILAGFILTHNLSVLLFAPFLTAYAAVWVVADWRRAGPRPQLRLAPGKTVPSALVGCLVMGLLGVGLTAFFTLPALMEIDYVHAAEAAEIIAGTRRYAQYMIQRLDQLFALPWPGVELTNASRTPFLALVGALAAFLTWPRLRRLERWQHLFFTGMALVSLFLASRLSSSLWESFRPLLYLQYPWRWYGPLSLAMAYLVGGITLLVAWLPKGYRRLPPGWLALVSVAVTLLWIVPGSLPSNIAEVATVPGEEKPLEEADLQPDILAKYDFQTGLWLREHGGPWLFEYMPIWADSLRDRWFLPDEGLPTEPPLPVIPRIQLGRQAALFQEMTVQTPQAVTLRWRIFYFPGWQVRVDGEPVKTTPSTELGLVTATVPAGEHRVTLRFESTPPRRVGSWISLGSLLLLLGLVVWRRLWGLLLGLLLVGALIFLPLKWHQSRASAIYTPTPPAEPWTNFDGRAQLLGYHVWGPPRPGQPLLVTLHWQALRRVTDNDQVFVALVDLQGVSRAQTDGQPGFFYTPTSRWQPGEFIPDTYKLLLPPDLPPGEYQLRMGLYDPATGARRPVYDQAGNTADQLLLGSVTVRP